MITPTEGWALTANCILHTTSEGKRWVDTTPTGDSFTFLGGFERAFFADPYRAFVAESGYSGAPSVFSTTDGGKTWRETVLAGVAPGSVTSIVFSSPRGGWILVSEGVFTGSEAVALLQTSDGGDTWQLVGRTGPQEQSLRNLPFFGTKSGLGFLNDATGWLSGTSARGELWFYSTHDGGLSWQPQPLAAPQGIPLDRVNHTFPPRFLMNNLGVLPIEIGPAWIVMYVTRDGGRSWRPTKPLELKSNYGVRVVPYFLDELHGWVTAGNTVYRTTDSANTWSIVGTFGLNEADELDFVSPLAGWAIVSVPGYVNESHVVSTVDGGATWESVGG